MCSLLLKNYTPFLSEQIHDSVNSLLKYNGKPDRYSLCLQESLQKKLVTKMCLQTVLACPYVESQEKYLSLLPFTEGQRTYIVVILYDLLETQGQRACRQYEILRKNRCLSEETGTNTGSSIATGGQWDPHTNRKEEFSYKI